MNRPKNTIEFNCHGISSLPPRASTNNSLIVKFSKQYIPNATNDMKKNEWSLDKLPRFIPRTAKMQTKRGGTTTELYRNNKCEPEHLLILIDTAIPKNAI